MRVSTTLQKYLPSPTVNDHSHVRTTSPSRHQEGQADEFGMDENTGTPAIVADTENAGQSDGELV